MCRALALVLMGGWLAGSVLMWLVAAENFRRVDRILTESRPELKERIAPMKEGDARLVLRLLASELNRSYFRMWGAAQLLVGGLILALSFWDRSINRKTHLLLGSIWMLTALLLVLVASQLIDVGRQIDFLPRTPTSPQIVRFWRLHWIYTLVDVVKVGLGVWVLRRLLILRSLS